MNAPARDLLAQLRDLFVQGKRDLVRAVREEMRGCALTLSREDVRPTGPHNSDIEQEVLSALLCGHTTVEALKPLESSHFYSNFNQHLFAVMTTTVELDLQALAQLLDMRGPVFEELTTIKDSTPFAAAATLRKHVVTIMDRWRERGLIREMQQIDAELRTAGLTVDDARQRLREFFMGAAK
jgi:replicative DNA helicase